jgi:ABC-type oligopeptide transport system substrate-binding subunit
MIRIWGLALVAAVALLGCRKTGGEAVQSAARKDPNPKIFYRNLTEPEFLDPGLCAESQGGMIVQDTFEGLYVYGPDHQTWVPGLALRHEVSPDGLTWTFYLRQSTWSDGTPLTAHDFVWSWKRALDPATGGRYASVLWFIEGAKAYNQSSEADRGRLRDAVGVHAVDAHTLQVRLRAPTPFFKQLTAFYTYSPVPRHVLEKHGDRWARPEHIVSNGPWRLAEWAGQQHIILKQNPRYHSPAAVPFEKVVYRITQDSEPAHRMYLSGDLDFLDASVPTSVLPRYRREKFGELRTSPYLGVYYYDFNVQRAPFDDPRVRQALGMAINKEIIGKFVVKGGQLAAPSLVPPGLADLGYPRQPGAEYDPDRARALLAEAGFAKGVGFPRFRISYNTSEGHRLIAEFVQQAWKKELGITCDLENMEWKVLLKRQSVRDFDVTRSAWIGDYLDANTFLELFESSNPNNHTGWLSPEYDALLGQVAVARTQPERQRLLAAAEQVFLRELPGIPLYYYVRHDLVKPWVQGYRPHLQGVHLTRWFEVAL